MRLYLFTRNDNSDWDEYVGAVVASTSSQAAKAIMLDLASEDWKCTLLAEITEPGVEEGIILDSFNNG